MPKLSQVQKADKTLDVTIPGESPEDDMHVVCYPNRITGKRRRELADLDDDDTEGYADLFFDILKSWDLTDDAGKALPFNADTVDLLSVPTTIRLFTEIGEAANPNSSKTSKRRRGR